MSSGSGVHDQLLQPANHLLPRRVRLCPFPCRLRAVPQHLHDDARCCRCSAVVSSVDSRLPAASSCGPTRPVSRSAPPWMHFAAPLAMEQESPYRVPRRHGRTSPRRHSRWSRSPSIAFRAAMYAPRRATRHGRTSPLGSWHPCLPTRGTYPTSRSSSTCHVFLAPAVASSAPDLVDDRQPAAVVMFMSQPPASSSHTRPRSTVCALSAALVYGVTKPDETRVTRYNQTMYRVKGSRP